VRLRGDQLCAACDAGRAWSQLDGARLVIDRDSIDLAVRRRRGEAAGAPVWRRLVTGCVPAVTLGLAAVAGGFALRLFAAQSLGPLGGLLDELSGAARRATLGGLAALIAGIAALIALRRHRQFRQLVVVASHGLAIVIGCAALVVGGVHWLSLRGGLPWRYTSMPVRASLGASSAAERIVNATVVVLAADADGDARNVGLGTGAVVAADDARAWIVTCSHVAIPDTSVSAWRRARDAQPVWVQLSDGREGKATVRWTAPPPLDVALVELPIAHPPEPVAIAPDTAEIQAAASVMFVPNPYRAGWKVVTGALLRREAHRTPAGTYDLLFTDLPVTFGDSGSGLFDARGQLVGLNTWTQIRGDGPSQGISLPSETLRVLADAIHDGRLDKLDEALPPRAASLTPAMKSE
jgi:S1-C subfamily serine protease